MRSLRGPLAIGVVNGDLLFVREPLLVGHYVSLRLTGTEEVVDPLLRGALSASLAAGAYPGALGEHRVFANAGVARDNPLQPARPAAAIVVGLGAEGKLRLSDLSRAVCEAVIAWSHSLASAADVAPSAFGIASTLMGSGGTGVAVGPAALALAQGVREANARLAREGRPVVAALRVIELYLDRATEAWRALQAQVEASPGDFVLAPTIRFAPGALPRTLDAGYRGADYDFVAASTDDGADAAPRIAYTLDTRRARSEVRAQAMHTAELRELIARASGRPDDTEVGAALFRMLIPPELEPFLGATSDMVIQVDGGTAGIPWEMVDRGGSAGNALPWAIRAKLLRKLRTAEFRASVADADADAAVLVIGEPACDPKRYPPLPGAREEALAVAQCLGAVDALGAERVVALASAREDAPGPDARTVVDTLLARDWRIVHIAGHGALPEVVREGAKRGARAGSAGNPRGVVLSDGLYLGSPEIARMKVVPELVFVNCCHLGARDARELLKADRVEPVPDRARFAAGVAQALIEIGVRCVVAAGWAVDDGAGAEFASRFYGALLRGRRFIDAVAEAREGAYAFGGNTWAAYQCYGDPDWRFARNVADAQRPSVPLAQAYAGIADPRALALALETIAVGSLYQKKPPREQRAKLSHLRARYAGLWRDVGAVAEAFGRAYDALGDRVAAIGWYAQALAANDGSASIKAAEQLGNLRARQAWATADTATRTLVGRRSPSGAALARAREEIGAALRTLEQVRDVAPTIERESLCGSAWKRLALIEGRAGRVREEARALRQVKLHYARAEALARDALDPALFYPALNRMAAELVVDGDKRRWRGFQADEMEGVRACLAAKTRDDPEFWSVAGLTELRVYVAISKKALSAEIGSILTEVDDLHTRIKAPGAWDSVLDQLRFVLPKYTLRASAREKAAANALLARVARYAGPSRRPGRSPGRA